MRLAITGGGTGGHVFPALEIARLARERGHELLYLGSLRGHEAAACRSEGIDFEGFPSEPLYSVRTLRGMKAALKLLTARVGAKAALRRWKPDVLFSTGGYSAGPVVSAARSLKIPYVLLEANSVPGRSNALFARQAKAVATVFRGTERRLTGARVVRTGMPIRKVLRESANQKSNTKNQVLTVLVTGGSQGSDFLNQAVPRAAAKLARPDVHWLHVAGKTHSNAVQALVQDLGLNETGSDPSSKIENPKYEVVPFLEADSMASAYAQAALVVGRSGGSLAEVALFGIASVLVPLPTSAGDHQTRNAQEFVEMGAAILHRQDGSTAEKLAADIAAWLDDPERRARAAEVLKAFDVPDATEKILVLIEEAAK